MRSVSNPAIVDPMLIEATDLLRNVEEMGGFASWQGWNAYHIPGYP